MCTVNSLFHHFYYVCYKFNIHAPTLTPYTHTSAYYLQKLEKYSNLHIVFLQIQHTSTMKHISN